MASKPLLEATLNISGRKRQIRQPSNKGTSMQPSANSDKTVISIDLGYGLVKYTTSSRNGEPAVLRRHFPARAIKVVSMNSKPDSELIG
jgi:hypothetical protein